MSYIGTEPKDIRSFGRTKFDYTATQGQTAFTGADDDGKVLAFTVGQIEVYVNGILMDDSDFTTTGTGTVTLASAANLNDVINIVSFESNIPDNDYVPATGGTFSGNVTHSGTVTNSGNVTVGGTLGVTGVTTMSGDLNVGSGGIHVTSPTGIEGLIVDTDQSNTNVSGRIVLKNANDASSVYYSDSLGWTFHTGTVLGSTSGTQRAYLTPQGYLRTPYQPAIEVSGPAITPANATWTKFDLDSNVLSRGGMSLDTTNDRITVPATGYYLVNYWIMVNMSTNSSSVRALGVRLYKNGSIFNSRNYWSGHRFTSGNSTTHDSATGHFLVNCTANDYLELYMIGYDTTTGIVFQPYITVTFQG